MQMFLIQFMRYKNQFGNLVCVQELRQQFLILRPRTAGNNHALEALRELYDGCKPLWWLMADKGMRSYLRHPVETRISGYTHLTYAMLNQ